MNVNNAWASWPCYKLHITLKQPLSIDKLLITKPNSLPIMFQRLMMVQGFTISQKLQNAVTQLHLTKCLVIGIVFH